MSDETTISTEQEYELLKLAEQNLLTVAREHCHPCSTEWEQRFSMAFDAYGHAQTRFIAALRAALAFLQADPGAEQETTTDDQSRSDQPQLRAGAADPRDDCQNCHAAPATANWGGTYDAMSLARNQSLIQRWCKRCVLTAQIAHWRQLVPLLAEAEQELAALPSPAPRQAPERTDE